MGLTLGVFSAPLFAQQIVIDGPDQSQTLPNGTLIDTDDTDGSAGVGVHVQNGGELNTAGVISIKTAGRDAIGVQVDSASSANLNGSLIQTTGINSHAVSVSDGSVVSLENVNIETRGITGRGTFAATGGSINISNSHVATHGNAAIGLAAIGAGSSIQATDNFITTEGTTSYGAFANSDGVLSIRNTSIITTGDSAYGLLTQGTGTITSTGTLNISTAQESTNGVYGYRGGAIDLEQANIATDGDYSHGVLNYNSGDITLGAGNIKTQGDRARGLYAQGGVIATSSVNINTAGVFASAVESNGGTIIFTKGSVSTTGDNASGLFAIGTASFIDASESTIFTTGAGAHGAYALSTDQTLKLDNLEVSVSGANSDGVRIDKAHGVLTNSIINAKAGFGISVLGVDASGQSSTLNARNLQLNGGGATAQALGALSIQDSDINTSGNRGLLAYKGGSIQARRLNINTQGNGAAGVTVLSNYNGSPSSLNIIDSHITTNGSEAHGLFVGGGANVQGSNIIVDALGVKSSALHGESDETTVSTFALDNSFLSAQQAAAITVDSGSLYVALNNGSQISSASGRLLEVADGATIDLTANGAAKLFGDVIASNSGVANVHLKDYSVLSGSVANGSDLSIDETSAWAMSGSSNLKNLQNAGTIEFTPVASSASYKTLIAGNYVGNGGVIKLNTYLGADGSPSDQLIIDGGSATGSTGLKINNTAKADAAAQTTADGIKVVDAINGATTGSSAFNLLGDFVTKDGQQAVVGGAYAYTLQRGALKNPEDGDWYLRSGLSNPPLIGVVPPIGVLPPVDVVPPIGVLPPPVGPTPPPVEPKRYSPGVPLYEAYLQSLLDLNRLPTLQQRVGERYWSTSTTPVAVDAKPFTTDGASWVRVEHEHNHAAPDVSSSQSETRSDITRIQAGADALLKEYTDGTRVFAGANLYYGKSKTDVSSFSGNGNIDVDAYGVGATMTGILPNGIYIDGQASINAFKGDLSSDSIGKDLTHNNNGFGYAFSTEVGKRIVLDEQWTAIPQAQLSYSHVTFNDFHDTFGANVRADKGQSLLGRVGLAMDRKLAVDKNRSHIYWIVNLNSELLDGTRAKVADTAVKNRPQRLFLGTGLGGSYSWNEDKYEVYGELNIDTRLNDSTDNHSAGGTVGWRMRW
jgi:outer membrane autotransporter protein